MSNDRDMLEDEQQKVLEISADEFVSFLNMKAPAGTCAYCGHGEYGVSPLPGSPRTTVVATPVPGAKGMSVWYFPATCINCGYTAMFNTSVVLSAIKGETSGS